MWRGTCVSLFKHSTHFAFRYQKEGRMLKEKEICDDTGWVFCNSSDARTGLGFIIYFNCLFQNLLSHSFPWKDPCVCYETWVAGICAIVCLCDYVAVWEASARSYQSGRLLRQCGSVMGSTQMHRVSQQTGWDTHTLRANTNCMSVRCLSGWILASCQKENQIDFCFFDIFWHLYLKMSLLYISLRWHGNVIYFLILSRLSSCKDHVDKEPV